MVVRTLLFIAAAISSHAFADDCKLPALANHLRLEDFPAQPISIKHPAPPRLTSDAAKMYRTRIREGAKEAPSFAGNMIVTGWGCGTGCGQTAFINAETGYVWVAPFLETETWKHSPVEDSVGAYYCLSSKLYVLIGSLNDSDTVGIYYYLWTGRKLDLIKAVEYKSGKGSGGIP